MGSASFCKRKGYFSLLGFWGIKSCDRLVYGKSKLTIMYLEPWKRKIRELQESFEDLVLSHVFRESNLALDKLSEEGQA